jgi:HPt (histidine-containing phosphotransfer) domain-containing protein
MEKESIYIFINNYDGPQDILSEILSIFVQETPERLKIIENALDEGDYEQVAKTAHSLANSAGTLDLSATLENARSLETSAREEDQEKINSLFETIKSDLTRVVSEAERELEK